MIVNIANPFPPTQTPKKDYRKMMSQNYPSLDRFQARNFNFYLFYFFFFTRKLNGRYLFSQFRVGVWRFMFTRLQLLALFVHICALDQGDPILATSHDLHPPPVGLKYFKLLLWEQPNIKLSVLLENEDANNLELLHVFKIVMKKTLQKFNSKIITLYI